MFKTVNELVLISGINELPRMNMNTSAYVAWKKSPSFITCSLGAVS